jgi:gp187
MIVDKTKRGKNTMKIVTNKFQPWAGATDTYETIIKNNCLSAFEAMIEELYPNGIEETILNDLLWFEPEFIFEGLGIKIEE